MRYVSLLLCITLVVALSILLSSTRAGDDDHEAGQPMVTMQLTEGLGLEDFLRAVSMYASFPLLWDPQDPAIRGKSLAAARELTAPRDQFYDLLVAVLASYDLAVVPIGPRGCRVYRVMEMRQVGIGARFKPLPIELDEQDLRDWSGRDGLYVTTTIPVEHIRSLAELRTTLVRLVTPQDVGHVSEVPELRAFVVADFAPNVVTVYRMIKAMDALAAIRPNPDREPGPERVTEALGLAHASALALAPGLATLFGANLPPPADRLPPTADLTPEDGLAPSPPDLGILADERTNQLLVSGAPARVEAVKEAVRLLDLPAMKVPERWTHVIELQHVDATDLASALVQLFAAGSARIVPQEEKNALLVDASPDDFERLKQVVDALDKP